MKTKSTESVFLTVGTRKQKMLCEKLISDIKERYGLDMHVVSDEDFGCRIGSGGALINVIRTNYKPASKMLVINSGGMSKRSINYAVRGKFFANVMIDKEVISLLELLIINTKRLLSSLSSGVVVCCSDILVETSGVKIDFSNNIGFCVRTDFETGSRHGVMFCNSDNLLAEYPHKCSAEELREMSSKYNENGVLVDTGMIYLKDELCTSLQKTAKEKKIIEKLIHNKIELNLYPEIIALLAEKIDTEEYLYSFAQNDTHIEVRQILLDLLSSYSLEVCVLEKQKFVHLGSLRESLVNIIELSGEKGKYLNLNSYVDESSFVGENTVLDNVILENCCTVGSNCIVSDVSLDKGVVIEDNKAVCGVKLCDGDYITIVCDIDENPKTKVCSTELWEIPRFYRGKSYTDSFIKLNSSIDEEKYSLGYCVENADTDYYLNRCQYLRDMSSYTVNPDYISSREKIITRYFSNRKLLTHVKCKKDKVEVNLPVRVNLSGTWTDAMPYCIDNGGQVVNMAVTVDGCKPIKVTVEKITEKHIELCSDNLKEIFFFDHCESQDDLSDFNLHKAVLEIIGISSNTVLESGFRLTTCVSGIDKGSGLGTSSILLGGCFKALGEMFGVEYCDSEILEMVFVAEQIMKTGGGWQDQVGGFFPSLKVSTTFPGIEQKPNVQQIDLPESFRSFFSEKLILIPTGQRHFGRFIVNDVVNRYLAKNEDSLRGHDEIRKLNSQVIKSIQSEDFESFMNCLNRHFELLKTISPLVSNEKIDVLSQACRDKFVDAISICGAGGGGYLLGVLKDGVTAEMLQSFVKDKFSSIAGSVKKIDISD